MIIPIIVPMQVAVSQVQIPMSVSSSSVCIPMTVDIAYQPVGGDPYDGPYTVTPRLYDQSLDTYGKLMHDDVTVYEIPVVRTSNPHGGDTIVIG